MTEWQSCEDGKLRPFRSIRLESYRIIIDSIREHFGDIRVELSMEPVWVWKHLGLK